MSVTDFPCQEKPASASPHPDVRPPVALVPGPDRGPTLTPIETAGVNAWLTDTESALALTDALGQALAALAELR